MIILTLVLLTLLEGELIDIEDIAAYELNTTLEVCEKYIKPAFEQTIESDVYTIKVVAECIE